MAIIKYYNRVTKKWENAGSDVDLTGYATEKWVQEGYQPKGNYLTEHQDISGKLDADKLPEAIDDALAQAKASGEFDGPKGDPGYTPVKGMDYFDGDDYVLTPTDKTEIAELAAELVEVPSDEKEWKLIRTVVLDEDVQFVSITTDADGNPFEYDEIAIRSFTMEGEDGKNAYTGAIWVNDTDLTGHNSGNSVYFGFYARHITGYYSPTIAYLRPFCGYFAFSSWYHDSGIAKDTFMAAGYTSVDELLSSGYYKAPTAMSVSGVVNGANLFHNSVKAEKIKSFSYGAPYVDHLMAAGSIFEFYGR